MLKIVKKLGKQQKCIKESKHGLKKSKKYSKSCKIIKNAQHCTKKAKPFNKTREKTKICTAVKISTCGGGAGGIFFHLCD